CEFEQPDRGEVHGADTADHEQRKDRASPRQPRAFGLRVHSSTATVTTRASTTIPTVRIRGPRWVGRSTPSLIACCTCRQCRKEVTASTPPSAVKPIAATTNRSEPPT